MFMCNFSFTLQTSQLKVILLERGMDSATGSLALSLFASGVILGRMICGVALDKFPAYAVSAVGMGLPAIGLGLLATGTAEPAVIAVAVLLLGFALGAEGDILAYLVMTYFPLEIFSTVLGLLLGGLALAIAIGSFLLSLTLQLTGGFTLFLICSAIAIVVGSALFLMLRRLPRVR